jgi:adenine-specific DNA-methyltransferase
MSFTNALWLGDSVERLRGVPAASIHAVPTSPPFDQTFDYGTLWLDGDWVPLIHQLRRVLVPGGIVAWQVRNQIRDHQESCSAERQVLDFWEAGFWKNFTIFQRGDPHRPSGHNYYRTITPIYIFSKGRPRSFPLLRDRPNKWAGQTSRGVFRTADGRLDEKTRGEDVVADYGRRSDLWYYPSGVGHTYSEPWLADLGHGAIMNLQLARDLIRAFSRPGEMILDPYGGVATTAVAAILEGRRYLSIEREERFHRASQIRVRHAKIKRRAELMSELGF